MHNLPQKQFDNELSAINFRYVYVFSNMLKYTYTNCDVHELKNIYL